MDITVVFESKEDKNRLQVSLKDDTLSVWNSLFEIEERAYNPIHKEVVRTDFVFEGIGTSMQFISDIIELPTNELFQVEILRRNLTEPFVCCVKPSTTFAICVETTNAILAFVKTIEVFISKMDSYKQFQSVFGQSWDGSVLRNLNDFIIKSLLKDCHSYKQSINQK
ncbi:gp209 [Sphingomonas phage PAU]|uniref:gp209 n=1 Tax=Sphingomonas phage PAU TaxID=1150991 RepID=UPI000257336F|nr:gp209 [Sphingomonas phage PAU]AFF28207.1 gp209 [Sphingomonas phage PAU]